MKFQLFYGIFTEEYDTLIKWNQHNICRDVNYYYQMEICMENYMQKQTY